MKRLIVVIGGSSGIGLSVCKILKNEYEVINMSRRSIDDVNNIYLDVANPDSVKNAFKILVDNYNIPYAIIYCSGFVKPQKIFEIDDFIFDKTIKTNLYGAFYCTKEFLKYNNKDGKIIYISSTAGTRPQTGWSAYSASKAGLINFALTMSEELKSCGIKTYCISPGRCNTPLRKTLAPNEDGSKIMQPCDVAGIIYQLINDDGLLDGQNIIVKKEVKP